MAFRHLQIHTGHEREKFLFVSCFMVLTILVADGDAYYSLGCSPDRDGTQGLY